MNEVMKEAKMFIKMTLLILIIVFCLLSKYMPIRKNDISSITYNPESKTTLILENIENKI